MYLLSTTEIVRSVRQTLEEFVETAVTDEFARVQLRCSLTALDEVLERLQGPDPLDDENRRLIEDLSLRAERSEGWIGDALRALLAADDPGEEPRARNRRLKQGLWELLSGRDPAATSDLLGGIAGLVEDTVMADTAWICPEALASLL